MTIMMDGYDDLRISENQEILAQYKKLVSPAYDAAVTAPFVAQFPQARRLVLPSKENVETFVSKDPFRILGNHEMAESWCDMLDSVTYSYQEAMKQGDPHYDARIAHRMEGISIEWYDIRDNLQVFIPNELHYLQRKLHALHTLQEDGISIEEIAEHHEFDVIRATYGTKNQAKSHYKAKVKDLVAPFRAMIKWDGVLDSLGCSREYELRSGFGDISLNAIATYESLYSGFLDTLVTQAFGVEE